jgi:hypothetical protein
MSILQQVLQIAVTVTRSFGCDNSVTRLGAAVVQKVRPKPSMKRLMTNMAKLTLSHWRIAPMIMMTLPVVIPHLLPYLSAIMGASGVEQMLPRAMIALMRPSVAPRGLPKKSSQYETVWREFIMEPS